MAVVKSIELVGSSKTSTDDAAKQALAQAEASIRNIRAVDGSEKTWGTCAGELVEWKGIEPSTFALRTRRSPS